MSEVLKTRIYGFEMMQSCLSCNNMNTKNMNAFNSLRTSITYSLNDVLRK